MPLRTLIMSAATAFVIATALALVTGYRAHEETRTVDFSTEPATNPGPVGALEAALAYTATNDLTDCVSPAHARLDDVVLTVPNDPKLVSSVVAVDFDGALRSGEEERWNVLACRPPGAIPTDGPGPRGQRPARARVESIAPMSETGASNIA